jgi:hypothetical protein
MGIKLWSGNRKGKEHSNDLGIDGRILELDRREIGSEMLDWICLAQGRD